MKIFVTGGSGVVGRGVVPALIAAGHQVTALAHSAAGKQRLDGQGARTVQGDLTAPDGWLQHVTDADAVVHMAQMTPPGRVSKKAIVPIGKADVEATRRMLDAAKGRAKPFIYTSGAWVYGPTTNGARDEQAPTNPYPLIEYKLEGERLVLDAAKRGDVAGMVTRPGTVYASWGLFEQYVLKPSKEKKKASVLGTGLQRTSYVHAEDVGAMYRCMLEDPSPGEIFNLADTEPVQVKTMVQEVAKHMGAKDPGTVPGFVIKLVMGLLGPPLLGDNPVSGDKLVQRYKFKHRYPTYKDGAAAVCKAYQAGGSTA